MKTGTRRVGDFCWINMLTPAPDEARDFFGSLLGWSYVELPGMGHLVQVDGRDIGGLFDLAGPNTPPGTPPLIGVMVKVENADATSEKIVSLGGRAQPAFDIVDRLRMAVCHDPSGAEFDVWEPKQAAGTDVDSSQHGAPGWFATKTNEAERASSFYADLFGWTPEPSRDSRFTMFRHGREHVAGVISVTDSRPHWATYFTVRNADETARQAVALGGTVTEPVSEVANIGRSCAITSPQGVSFHVVEPGNV